MAVADRFQQAERADCPAGSHASRSLDGKKTICAPVEAAEQRVQYVLEDRVYNTKWYVIYEIANGREEFSSREVWECGEWREHHPSVREREVARELMAQGKARSDWRTVLSSDGQVTGHITDLGHFPECVRSAMHEFREMSLDSGSTLQIRFASALCHHMARGEQLITGVYRWMEEHRYYRRIAHHLNMKRGA